MALLPYPEEATSFTNLIMAAPPVLEHFYGVVSGCSCSCLRLLMNRGGITRRPSDELGKSYPVTMFKSRDSSGASGVLGPVTEVATVP